MEELLCYLSGIKNGVKIKSRHFPRGPLSLKMLQTAVVHPPNLETDWGKLRDVGVFSVL